MLLTDLINNTFLNTTKNVITNVNPTVSNDISTGVSVFSVWHNTATNEFFDCKSNTLGAAVWVPRIDTGNIVTRNIVTSDVIAGGNNTVKINNIVSVSNTNYNNIVTPNANTAYFIEG